MAETTEGKSLDDLTADDFFDGVEGSVKQLSFELGSDYSLSRSSLRVPALGDVLVKGQFNEGDRVRITLDVEIDKVHFDPIRDRHKNKVGIERKHLAQIIDWAEA